MEPEAFRYCSEPEITWSAFATSYTRVLEVATSLGARQHKFRKLPPRKSVAVGAAVLFPKAPAQTVALCAWSIARPAEPPNWPRLHHTTIQHAQAVSPMCGVSSCFRQAPLRRSMPLIHRAAPQAPMSRRAARRMAPRSTDTAQQHAHPRGQPPPACQTRNDVIGGVGISVGSKVPQRVPSTGAGPHPRAGLLGWA